MAGQVDVLGRTLDLMKAAGVPAGFGSHSLETPMASEKHGLNPDYFVKTFHPDNYWSATPPTSARNGAGTTGRATIMTGITTTSSIFTRTALSPS